MNSGHNMNSGSALMTSEMKADSYEIDEKEIDINSLLAKKNLWEYSQGLGTISSDETSPTLPEFSELDPVVFPSFSIVSFAEHDNHYRTELGHFNNYLLLWDSPPQLNGFQDSVLFLLSLNHTLFKRSCKIFNTIDNKILGARSELKFYKNERRFAANAFLNGQRIDNFDFSYTLLGKNFYIPLSSNHSILNLRHETHVIDRNGIIITSIKEPTTCFAVTAAGRVAMGCNNSNLIRIYQYHDDGQLSLLKIWDAHKKSVRSLTIVDNQYLISGGGGGIYSPEKSIKIWNMTTTSLVSELESSHTVPQLFVLPGRFLCSVQFEQIKIWNLYTRDVELTMYRYHDATLIDTKLYMLDRSDQIRSFNASAHAHNDTLSLSTISSPRMRLHYLYNSIKTNRNKALFSNFEFREEDFEYVILLVKSARFLIVIDLSYTCKLLSANRISHFSNEIQDVYPTHSNLLTLNLSGNNLKKQDVEAVAEGVQFSNTLTTIDVSNNLIEIDTNYLDLLHRLFAKAKSIRSVDVSHNYVAVPRVEIFDEPEPQDQQAEQADNSPIHRYLFFKTSPKDIPSCLDNKIKINPEKWVVSLSAPRNDEHSILFLEGMGKEGMLFLQRFHLLQDDSDKKKAFIEGEKYDRSRGRNINKVFYHSAYSITQAQGIALQRLVEDDRKKNIRFSFFASIRKDSGTTSCLTWAYDKLIAIGLDIPKKFPFTPIYQSGGPLPTPCSLTGNQSSLISCRSRRSI